VLVVVCRRDRVLIERRRGEVVREEERRRTRENREIGRRNRGKVGTNSESFHLLLLELRDAVESDGEEERRGMEERK